MIVVVVNSGRSRILSTKANPSMWGMCMSVKINLYGSPASRAADSCAKASAPLSANTGCTSHRSSIPSRILRLVRLSSTTSTFTPRKISGGTAAPTVTSFACAALT